MLTRRELVVTVVLLLVQTGYFFGLRAVQTCALPSAEPELVPMPVRTLPPPTPVPEETTTSPVPEETAPRVVIESPLLIGSPLVIKDRFYIYEEAVNFLPGKPCYGCWSYTCTTRLLYHRLKDHPLRTLDPSEATLFYVPFSFEGSYYGFCKESEHWQRVVKLLEMLRSSPWYKRHEGRDHFVDALHWVLGHHEPLGNMTYEVVPEILSRGEMRNFIIGRYLRLRHGWTDTGPSPVAKRLYRYDDVYTSTEWGWVRGQLPRTWNLSNLWSRSVVVPVAGNLQWKPWVGTFADWMARPKLFYFRGAPDHHRTLAPRQRNRFITTVKWLCPNSTVSEVHARDKTIFWDELTSHKFAWIVRGDDLQTSRVWDGIVTGVIPILLSDGWKEVVSPFNGLLDWDRWTFTIPQYVWENDPEGAVRMILTQPEFVLRSKFEALMEVRKLVLWHLPDSHVANLVLHEAFQRTKDVYKNGRLFRPLEHYTLDPMDPRIHWGPLPCTDWRCYENMTKTTTPSA